MALKIIPPHGFTGTRSGVDFAQGTAEVESIGTAEFMDLAAAGFIIEGSDVPSAEDIAQAAAEEDAS